MSNSSSSNSNKYINALVGSCGPLLGGESYFSTVNGDDNDDISNVKRGVKALAWREGGRRGEGADNDWTIIAATTATSTGTNSSTTSTRTFHVHKSIISVGPRSSKYFSRLFVDEGNNSNHFNADCGGGGKHHRNNNNNKNKNQSQSTTTTRIELDEQDANSFPIFLDFMYLPKTISLDNDNAADDDDDDDESLFVNSNNGNSNNNNNSNNNFLLLLTTFNAISLRHLSRIFDCDGLMQTVNKFIFQKPDGDLSVTTGIDYLLQADLYQDTTVFNSAKKVCIQQFSQLDTRALLRLPLELFRSIIIMTPAATKAVAAAAAATAAAGSTRSKKKKSINNSPKEELEKEETEEEELLLVRSSYHRSEAVCQYFEKYPNRMNIRILLELTNESIMPQLASESAIGFTALIAQELNPNDIHTILMKHHHHHHNNNNNNADSNSNSKSNNDVDVDVDAWKGLVALCQRCAHAVVNEYGWKDFNVASALEEYLYGPGFCAPSSRSGSLMATTTKLKVDSLLFATSFAETLKYAQHEYHETIKMNQPQQHQHDGSELASYTTKEQMQKLKMQNDNLHWQNQCLKKEKDRYKNTLADTNDELLFLRQQVKKFQKREKRDT